MAFNNEALTIEINARNLAGPAFQQVNAQLEKLNQAAAQSAGATSRLEASFGMLRAGLAALPIAFVVGKMNDLHAAATQLAVRINDQSEALGLTVRQYQALQVAAAGAGVEESKMVGAVSALNVKIGEAVRGKKEAIEAFDKLGVKILDVNGKQRAEMAILEEVALKLSRVEDVSKRAALAKDIFGSSGARLTALLRTLGDGLERTAMEAERAGLVMDEKVIKALDKLDRAGNETSRAIKVLYAEFAAPIATKAFEQITAYIKDIRSGLEEMGRIWRGVFGGGDPRSALQAQIAGLEQERADQARHHGERSAPVTLTDRRLAAMRAQLAGLPVPPNTSRGYGGAEPAPGTISLTGASNPAVVASGGGGAADKAGEALAALRTQIREINEAYLTLRTTTTETAKDSIAAAELHMRIETQLAATLRNVPANDPRRQQIIDQTRALEEARTRYDEFKKAIQLADQTQARFGDGAREHAETLRLLNEALATGRLSQDAYALAVRDANERLREQADRAAEARGGMEGLTAGFLSAMRARERADSTFRVGAELFEQSTRLMSESLINFARTGEISFSRILGSFADMLIQMGLRAASSQIFSAIGGLFGPQKTAEGGGGGGGLLGGLLSAAGSLFGFAEGGRPPMGKPSLVGENGAELFMPDVAGTVYNQRQLAGMAGDGGTSIVINQTFGGNIGGATRAELYKVGQMAVEAARNAVYDAKRRGGSYGAAFA